MNKGAKLPPSEPLSSEKGLLRQTLFAFNSSRLALVEFERSAHHGNTFHSAATNHLEAQLIREKLIEKGFGLDKKFRMRGTGEVSRIEALSDAVFGFAITLLVVSLEVPQTFTELLEVMRGFAAFAISFVMLFVVWLTQYKFFRRYGLNDNFIIWMNALLLFVVLFYVYPLKFLWSFLVNALLGFTGTPLGPDGRPIPPIEGRQIPSLLIIFGIGYAAIFLIFALLYYHAYRKRAQLKLNQLEIHDTWNYVLENLLHVAIAVISIAVTLITRSGFGGAVYWLIGPVQYVNGVVMGRSRKRLEQRLEAASEMQN